MPRFVTVVLALLTWAASPVWAEYETQARAAFVVDVGSGTVLFAKDPDLSLPPASMSKLMTLNMLFEALNDGRVDMETQFGVSRKAHVMGGSKMFLAEGSRVAIKDLIPGIIVGSGNDACIVVAEGLAGSEEAFARLMTQRAKALGMNDSTFANASGWPHPDHRMSVRDLAFLGNRLITEFPMYYPEFSRESFTWEDITQANRNPLLGLGIGADGLKTGHTEEAGYGLVGSAKLGERRVVFVVTGLESAAERARESEQIVNWAFRQFVNKPLVKKDEALIMAPVWMGEESEVGLVSSEDFSVLMPALTQEDITARVEYIGPIEAPVKAGQPMGALVIERDGLRDARFPLVADRDILEAGFMGRIKTSAQMLVSMAMNKIGSFF